MILPQPGHSQRIFPLVPTRYSPPISTVTGLVPDGAGSGHETVVTDGDAQLSTGYSRDTKTLPARSVDVECVTQTTGDVVQDAPGLPKETESEP